MVINFFFLPKLNLPLRQVFEVLNSKENTYCLARTFAIWPMSVTEKWWRIAWNNAVKTSTTSLDRSPVERFAFNLSQRTVPMTLFYTPITATFTCWSKPQWTLTSPSTLQLKSSSPQAQTGGHDSSEKKGAVHSGLEVWNSQLLT